MPLLSECFVTPAVLVLFAVLALVLKLGLHVVIVVHDRLVNDIILVDLIFFTDRKKWINFFELNWIFIVSLFLNRIIGRSISCRVCYFCHDFEKIISLIQIIYN